jgi:hypothetical protein
MIIVAVKLFCYSHITNLGKIVLQMGCSDEIIQQNDNCNEGGGGKDVKKQAYLLF